MNVIRFSLYHKMYNVQWWITHIYYNTCFAYYNHSMSALCTVSIVLSTLFDTCYIYFDDTTGSTNNIYSEQVDHMNALINTLHQDHYDHY